MRKKTVLPYQSGKPFHSETEKLVLPDPLTYDKYITYSDQCALDPRREPVHGCKKKWSLCMLPYADKIVTFTDPMHVLGNVIGDSLLILHPGDQNKEHRSAGAAVLEYEQETNGRFHEGYHNFCSIIVHVIEV